MRSRRVSPEEHELWRRAVRDVRETRRPKSASSAKAGYAPEPQSGAHKTAPLPPPDKSAPRVPPAPTRKTAHRVFGGGDPKLDRAAASRRMQIERTLDLHGMTQIEAHRLLLQFVTSAATDGVRLILVITGKGDARRGPEGKRGVLKSRFLDWIEEPPLKGEIARVASARQKDGGAGAFYVFLKNKSARNFSRF